MENSIKFSDCTCELLESIFQLEPVRNHPAITEWFSGYENIEVTGFESGFINQLNEAIIENCRTWNEMELIEYFIGPLFVLVNFNTTKFKMFSNRRIQAVINGYELFGEPDALIATGRHSPQLPYFCLNEYKKQEENKGDAAGQCLAAMLVAQHLTGDKMPVYGIYIVGKYWNFMVLQHKEYCITKTYNADDEEIFTIFRILKALKNIIINTEH